MQRQFETTTQVFKSFSYNGNKLWNHLPRHINKTLEEFKKHTTTYECPYYSGLQIIEC